MIVFVSGRPVALFVIGLRAGGDRDVAQQRQQPEQQRVGGQRHHVALDHVAAAGGQDARERVRVEEQRQRRAQRERDVLELVVRREQDRALRPPGGRVGLGELVRRGVEDRRPAAEPRRQVDHGHEDHDVDQDVLDERDQRGRPQPGLVGVDREDHERDEQRQVPGEPRAVQAHRAQHGLEPDELQRDVGHGRHEPGDRHEEGEQRAAVAAAHEVGRGDVAVHPRDRPQPQHRQEHQRIEDHGVGQGEEAHRTRAEQQRGHGDEGVGGVEVAADQEPGDPGAELAPAQPPLVEVLERLGPPPARRPGSP